MHGAVAQTAHEHLVTAAESQRQQPAVGTGVAARSSFRRYHIDTAEAPDVAPHPTKFRVHTRRLHLIGLLVRELVHYRGKLPVVLARPCVYGVFGRPVGGMAPIHAKCVGCLRCTTQYPDVVQIHPNPARQALGDSYLTPDHVDTILYEARGGRVPVRGAGYRGAFGGAGWDGMWTDMSEIVRPTRDGIHGRETISTVVDIGEKPAFLTLDADRPGRRGDAAHGRSADPDAPGRPSGGGGRRDAGARLERDRAAPRDAGDPAARARSSSTASPAPTWRRSSPPPRSARWPGWPRRRRVAFLDGWDAAAFAALRERLPGAIVGVRVGCRRRRRRARPRRRAGVPPDRRLPRPPRRRLRRSS